MAGTVVLSDQLRQLSSYFGFDTATLATVLRTDDLALGGSNKGTPSQRESRAILQSLIALQRRLDDMFTSHQGVERWLHGPSGYFGGQAPFDYLKAGNIDRVDAALDAIEAGIFV